MKNNKSINIYMGIIGEAYVDKKTAYKILLAAKKNILDVQAIIKFGEDLSRPLSQAASNASDAINDAVNVYNKLKNAINTQSKDGIIYKKLIALLADLNENDFDNDFSNGGNIYTARENLAFAERLETQRIEIISKTNKLLEANRLNAVVRCKEYNIAKEIFESMVPDVSINLEDLSDTLEDEYMKALKYIQSNISYISSSSIAISEVSNNVSNKIDNILNGTEENQQNTNNINYIFSYASENQDGIFTKTNDVITGVNITAIKALPWTQEVVGKVPTNNKNGHGFYLKDYNSTLTESFVWDDTVMYGRVWIILPAKFYDISQNNFVDEIDNKWKFIDSIFKNPLNPALDPIIISNLYEGQDYILVCFGEEGQADEQYFKKI